MSTQPAPPPQVKTLFVICHGALATLQTDNNLIVMIPDLGSSHTYRAGSWLTETSIEKDSLHVLQNVIGGTAEIVNPLGIVPRSNTAAQPPFATFVLPRPIKVHSLFEVSISKSAFSSTDGTFVPTADFVAPLVPIFEYSYTGKPRLGNIWPVASDDSTGLPVDPATLHIFAEDEVPLDSGHFINAFDLTCQLLGLNIKLSPEGAQQALTPGNLGIVPAKLQNRLFEFQPLSHRRAALLAVAKAKENGTAFSDPWLSLPTDLAMLGDAFFGQPDKTKPAPPAAGGSFSPRWKVPACAHVILGDIGVVGSGQ